MEQVRFEQFAFNQLKQKRDEMVEVLERAHAYVRKADKTLLEMCEAAGTHQMIEDELWEQCPRCGNINAHYDVEDLELPTTYEEFDAGRA